MNRRETKKPSGLYHYTSVAVLCKLFTGIKDGNLIFHASSVDFMNDGAEYAISRSLCKDHVEELYTEIGIGKPFALCFTDSENNIPMWSMYANGGKGVCLKFSFSKIEELYHQLKAQGKTIEFSQCEYSDISLPEETNKPLCADMKYPDTGQLWNEMKKAAFVKPDSFIHEREWRLMVWNSWESSSIQNILFKEVHDEICPYIEFPIPVNFLEEIILSPNANWQMEEAVKLMRYKYTNGKLIPVKISKITLKV